MIFILTVIIWCGIYLFNVMKEFDSDDSKERPWAYDHTAAMGAGFGFMIHLIMSIVSGIVLQVLFNTF